MFTQMYTKINVLPAKQQQQQQQRMQLLPTFQCVFLWWNLREENVGNHAPLHKAPHDTTVA